MNRLRIAVTLFVLQAGAALAAPAGHLIIISIDGMRPIEYSRPDSTVVKMPVLRAMAKSGCASKGVTTEFPSITYPNHTTMMTGQPPAIHGIVSNSPFDPFHLDAGNLYAFASQIHAATLWDAVKDNGGTAAAVAWPVTVGARIDYLVPTYENYGRSTPGLVAEIQQHNGRIDLSKADDAWRARAAAYIFERYKPTLTLLHLFESDEEQHGHAPGSPEAVETLEHLDRIIGQLRENVEKAAGSEGVTWLIVSDHGFQSYDRLFHPLIALGRLGYVSYDNRGKLNSWRIQVRDAGGMAALIARDPDDREAIEKTTEEFRRMAADPSLGIRQIYSRRDLTMMGAFPDAFLAFDMKDGFASGGATKGSLVTSLKQPQGAHGYGPGSPNMLASFILSGSHVAACGSLAPGRLADVAPTAAAVLGIEFPPVPGKAHVEALQRR